MSESRAKEIILGKIGQAKGKMFEKDGLRYSDVIDIVLYYISLQDDLDKIARVPTRRFSKILEEETHKWIKRVEKRWGKVKVPRFYGSEELYELPMIWGISGAWTPGPGPMGGTMSSAEDYEILHPGFAQHEYLILFFNYPEGLSKELCGNWPLYRKLHLEETTFWKWHWKIHQDRLLTAFDLAETVCQELRKAKPEKE
ncbi:MAG: hypothetical protein Q7S70_02440 [bacterium]|nr:hypothetical protein [bacterium]